MYEHISQTMLFFRVMWPSCSSGCHSVTSLSLHRPGFFPRAVLVEFMWDRVSLQHISLQVLHFSSQYHSTTAQLPSAHLPPVPYNLGKTQLPGQHSCRILCCSPSFSTPSYSLHLTNIPCNEQFPSYIFWHY